jgi:hypothetical protein
MKASSYLTVTVTVTVTMTVTVTVTVTEQFYTKYSQALQIHKSDGSQIACMQTEKTGSVTVTVTGAVASSFRDA